VLELICTELILKRGQAVDGRGVTKIGKRRKMAGESKT